MCDENHFGADPMAGEKRHIWEKLTGKGIIPPFWLINCVGWLAFIIIDTFVISPELLKDSYRLLSNAAEWSTGYLLTLFLRSIYRRFPYKKSSIFLLLMFVLFFSQLFAILFYLSAHILFIVLEKPDLSKLMIQLTSFHYFSQRQTQFMPIMTTWSMMYFGIKLWIDWMEEKKRAEQASLMAQSAQLQMLRYQVNPHFLFNTLSSLRALVSVDARRAEMMITKMSEFLRYSLMDAENDEVPLYKEIQIIKNYLDIEKVRFGEKLQIEYAIEQLAEEFPVPVFILNPIVENAIKHGMQSNKGVLHISISAHVKSTTLYISVKNSGAWRTQGAADGLGSGLNNIKNRLVLHSPNSHSFEIIKSDESVEVAISITQELRK
ncbi:MAG: histidine kinase [Ignavibacteria bacterium]|nr:histidine kinase [Ignavibacteria bacterium]